VEWLRRGSEAGHPAALVRLAEAETSADHLDEAERLLRSARDLEDTEAAVPLAALLQSRGRYAEAEQILLEELADGHKPESIMLLLAEYQQSPARTERWLRAAVAEGSMRAQAQLGKFLSVHRQYAEAEQLLQAAIEAGWIAARQPLADNFALQGRIAEADRQYERAAVERTRVGSPPTDWGTVVTTAVVTAAAVPFVKTLAQKAAEDSYAAVRKFIRHLIRTHGQRKREYGAAARKGPVLLVHDPTTGTILRLSPDLPDDAIRALTDASLTPPSDTARPVRLIWDRAKGQWTQITGPDDRT
jgi:tetratricopeptide (TPR) repeat protein